MTESFIKNSNEKNMENCEYNDSYQIVLACLPPPPQLGREGTEVPVLVV